MFRATLTRVLKGNFIADMEPQVIENIFLQYRVGCIASGQMEGEMKFYFFSKHVNFLILFLIFFLLERE